jgi:hypothetical protein
MPRATAVIYGYPRSAFSFACKKLLSQSRSVLVFQAGHASSILVTRSTTSFLVKCTFSLPNIFEYPGDNNDQAGHVHFMIITGDERKCLVGRQFMERAS